MDLLWFWFSSVVGRSCPGWETRRLWGWGRGSVAEWQASSLSWDGAFLICTNEEFRPEWPQSVLSVPSFTSVAFGYICLCACFSCSSWLICPPASLLHIPAALVQATIISPKAHYSSLCLLGELLLLFSLPRTLSMQKPKWPFKNMQEIAHSSTTVPLNPFTVLVCRPTLLILFGAVVTAWNDLYLFTNCWVFMYLCIVYPPHKGTGSGREGTCQSPSLCILTVVVSQ